ncbi:thioredoxin family protein [Gracilibacillus caseinilyticus]|uniref:Thioredoxin family protein n=1 Tax=Gracilibacillus caseinilyticus TaxID=2932256 RepID=A0ABY4ESF6_9BACI|nr:thioredoxin family protein [Gracilibacillus caseinilyticus]UOQ46818.1 thioredoxin family protein [Gracilibacillus caseinilyticus]
MKKMIIFVLLLVVIFGALVFVVQYQNSQKLDGVDNPYNKSDLDQATIDQLEDPIYQNQILPDELQEKLDNGEDVTVYFYSPTCIHCQRTTPVVVPMAEEYGVDLVKLNLLEFEAAWNEYSIEATPTIVRYEAGEETARIVGEHEQADFENFFEQEVLHEE